MPIGIIEKSSTFTIVNKPKESKLILE